MTNSAEKQGVPIGVHAWVEELFDCSFPMFPASIAALKSLGDEDMNRSVDRICSALLLDPGAVLTILRKANTSRKGRLGQQVTTVENAAMMIGINAMRQLPEGAREISFPSNADRDHFYLRTVSRAYHAAYQAYDWAILRGDMMPKEIFVAAFLHDLGEMVLWLHGGEQMLDIRAMMQEENMPEDEAQYVVLGFSQEQLGRELAIRWGLPQIVVECLRPEEAQNPRALSVMLAAQLARLVEKGWYNDEVYTCLENIADLLDQPLEDLVKRVHLNAVAAARETEQYGVMPAAAALPMLPGPWPDDPALKGRAVAGEEGGHMHFCLTPQVSVLDETIHKLKGMLEDNTDLVDFMRTVMRGLHDGIGLNRVVFAILSQDRGSLNGRFLRGTDNDPMFSRFHIDVDIGQNNLFAQLLRKPLSVWINDGNREKLWPLVPKKFKDLIKTDSFFAMSVFVKDKPVGIFYADRHFRDNMLDDHSYQRFKKLCQLASRGIQNTHQNWHHA